MVCPARRRPQHEDVGAFILPYLTRIDRATGGALAWGVAMILRSAWALAILATGVAVYSSESRAQASPPGYQPYPQAYPPPGYRPVPAVPVPDDDDDDLPPNQVARPGMYPPPPGMNRSAYLPPPGQTVERDTLPPPGAVPYGTRPPGVIYGNRDPLNSQNYPPPA